MKDLQWIKFTCRVVPFKNAPLDGIPDLPNGHEYTANRVNPNWVILCRTISGFIALTNDSRFIKV